MGLIDIVRDSLRFKDTIFLKESSDLQRKYDALKALHDTYPENEELFHELCIVKKGLDGENEISYQLKKAHIGMYVLRDIKVQYEDLTAQIDYVVITPVYTYYIECKNLGGNITVTEKGDFIREYVLSGKKEKKGMYSPLRQVEAQREVVKKIWESNVSSAKKLLASKNFNFYQRVFVVVANPETILNTKKAPKEMKYKILKADALIRQIEYDIKNRNPDDWLETRKKMEQEAQFYLNLSFEETIDYYAFYEKKYGNDLRNRLLNLRKNRAKMMNIPAYYVFTNEELEQLICIKPKTIPELKKAQILSEIKIKTHGNSIIEEINK